MLACLGVFGDRQGVHRSLEDVADTKVCAFTIRDSLREHDTIYQPGQRIIDFVDVKKPMLQHRGNLNQAMFDSGTRIEGARCSDYSKTCYRHKLLQAFRHMLRAHGECTHFFYVEADNTMCVPPSKLLEIVEMYPDRQLILTGVGASGWLMQRAWMEQFEHQYRTRSLSTCPDCVAASMPGWSTYYVYLVEHHTTGTSVTQGLTISRASPLDKHLPRCFEPHRDRWGGWDTWDYFEHSECAGFDIYPCR